MVAFPRSAQGAHSRIEASFRLRCDEGADGAAFALLNTGVYGTHGAGPNVGKWEEPNLTRSFAVGFDIYNPPTENRFDENGNVYSRPQREVSVHWDGTEVANALSPVEFRGGEFHDVHISIRHVIGGALVSVTIDDTDIYHDHFIAEMVPHECRVALAGRTGGMTTRLAVDDLTVEYLDPIASADRAARQRYQFFAREIVHAGNRTPVGEFQLAPPDLQVARIILTLSLAAPPGDFDPWDRSAAIYAWGDDGERYEICRYITPFGRGYTWKVDVTDYQSILRGHRKMGLYIDTWVGGETHETRQGWKVSVDLDYYPGTPEREAFSVTNLWSGQPEYGNPDHPMADWFAPRTGVIGADAKAAKLRFMVTGHGMSPSSKNAAEFMPAGRTVTVNETSYENTLWKTDVYLNPCRPQGGTWKFDRAGWAPGDIVTPWDIDITDAVAPAKPCAITYTPAPY
ncbi:MAG TPA: peptide-N-glycosidase F-related protein, partial [Dehalococcoidia bacterium]|nr:peptide-N-glycosidase F-related protein [Dehalococcoidia bacterium]